jgi:transposase InsO family protein
MMMVSPPALAPLHNAVVESFIARLKRELFAPLSTRQEARSAIFEYVEGFYNRARPHSTLGAG